MRLNAYHVLCSMLLTGLILLKLFIPWRRSSQESITAIADELQHLSSPSPGDPISATSSFGSRRNISIGRKCAEDHSLRGVWRPHGDVAVLSYNTTWTVMQWNYFTVVSLNCGGHQGAPCCNVTDFLRVQVTFQNVRISMLRNFASFVSSHANGDGTYTFGIFPVFEAVYLVTLVMSPVTFFGESKFQQPWKTDIHAKKAHVALPAVTAVGPGGLSLEDPEPANGFRFCSTNDLHYHGVWLQGTHRLGMRPPKQKNTYYVPEARCRLKPSWTGEEIRKCLHHRNILFNGDSSLVEMVSALQAKLYDNFAWGRQVFEPRFRQWDAVNTNANEVLTKDDIPGSIFRTRIAHFWNAAHFVDGNFQGLKTYDIPEYVNMLRNHSSHCTLMAPKHRTNRKICGPQYRLGCILKPMMLISLLLNETRSPPTCGPDISPTPDAVVVASGMHDYRWMNGSILEIPKYRMLLNRTLALWKELAPKARLALRVTPVPSLQYRHEHVLINMMNVVACEVAAYHGAACLDVFSLTFPFADSEHTTDGHHWLQNARVKNREKAHKRALFGTYLGEAYLSTLYTFLCDQETT